MINYGKHFMKSRFIILFVALIAISVGWIFGWNYLSDKTEKALAAALERSNQGARHLNCDNQRTGGFPFRLTVECDKSSFIKGERFGIELAGLSAQAFVYRPHHQVVDFKSPALITAGPLGTLQLVWEKARLGSELQSDGLSAATAKIENARLSILNPPPGLGNTSLGAQRVTLSARRSGGNEEPDSIVFGLLSNGLEVLGEQYRLPPVAVEASVLAYGIASVFEGRGSPFPLWIEKGGEADIHGVSLVSGNAQLFAKGWMKLDQNGFIHADLDVDSANMTAFVDALGPELVQIQSVARAIIAAIEGLGEDVTLGTQAAKRVKVTIRKSFVNIGLIPVGAIPQIDLSRI